MSSEEPEMVLRIAEALRKNDAPSKICSDLKTSVQVVNAVRTMVENGEILFSAEGKATYTKAASREIDRVTQIALAVLSEEVIQKSVKEVREDFILGNMLRNTFSRKAEDAGVTLEEYVTNALVFYEEYSVKIEELEQGRALIETSKMFIRRGFVTLKRLDLYNKFVDRCMLMRMRGFEIPSELPTKFMDDLRAIEDMDFTEERLVVEK